MHCFRKGKQGFRHCTVLHLRCCLNFGSCSLVVFLFFFLQTEVDSSKFKFHIRFNHLLHSSKHSLANPYDRVQWWFKVEQQYCVCKHSQSFVCELIKWDPSQMMWWCIALLLCRSFPIHFFLSQLVQTSNTSLNIINCIANPHWPGWTAPLTKKDKTKQKKAL